MEKPNKRPAPAYQEFAADMLAKREFRLMTFAERGLLMTMRLECWVNKCVPSKGTEIAFLFGASEQDIVAHLTPNVLSFFFQDGTNLICPELDAYRQNLEATTAAKSKGGSNGGKATQKKAREAKYMVEGMLEASLKPLSKNESNRTEKRGEELTNQGVMDEHRDFINALGEDNSIRTSTYEKQSRGH